MQGNDRFSIRSVVISIKTADIIARFALCFIFQAFEQVLTDPIPHSGTRSDSISLSLFGGHFHLHWSILLCSERGGYDSTSSRNALHVSYLQCYKFISVQDKPGHQP